VEGGKKIQISDRGDTSAQDLNFAAGDFQAQILYFWTKIFQQEDNISTG